MKSNNIYYRVIKSLFFYFLLLTFIACQNKNDNKFDGNLIEKIAQEDTKLPSKFSFILFFGKCSEDKVALIFIEDLKSVHSLKYKNLSFLEFLRKSLNQEINIEYQNKIECFDLDKGITTNYNNNNFESFLNLYVNKKNEEMELKSTINSNQRNTISYYLFINNYLVCQDDYVGKYFVNKTSSFYNL